MSDYEEIRRNRFEPAPPAGEAGFEPPFSAAERHRRARVMREAAKPNPLLESLAGSGVAEPVMSDMPARPASRAEKGVFASLRRFLFGRGSREENRRSEPYRPEDDDIYASAVASAVRMASCEHAAARTGPGYPIPSEPADNENAMYPHSQHHLDVHAQPQVPEPALQVAPQQLSPHAPWPPAQMMQPVAFWPVHPACGWPMPPQAYGAPPFDPAMQWPPHPAHAAPYAAPYAPPPQGWQQQVIAHQPAPAALPQRVVDMHPVMPAEDDAEMEDLRESVRALRDMVELLMQRRSERGRWAA